MKSSPFCCLCNLYDETPYHTFHECDRAKCLWSDLDQCFQNKLILPTLTPQTSIFGFLNLQTTTPFLKTINFLAIISY